MNSSIPGISQLNYGTVIGTIQGAEGDRRTASVVLRVNGRTTAKEKVTGDSYRLDIGYAVLPSETVEVVELDDAERVIRISTWGELDRRLPESWRTAGHPRYPSLFVLGAAKSATTSMHLYLDQHPAIFMSKPKEPFFFEAEFERGAEYYYNKYFGGWTGEPHVGESRHRNLYLPFVPSRIHTYNPDARLIAILRNPAERAVSHWWHWYSVGLEDLAPREAFEADLARIDAGESVSTPDEISLYRRTLGPAAKSMHRTYIDTGYYADQIERYLKFFPKEQLHIVIFEDLRQQPVETMRKVFEFLGADPAIAPLLNYGPFNTSRAGMWEHIDDSVWNWLLEHYAPHNRRLEQLLGRGFAHWTKPRPTHSIE